MNGKKTSTRIKYAFASVLAIGAAAATMHSVGCSSDNTTTTTAFTTDPYVYYTYYPADVSVASYYWADDWVFTGLFALNSTGGYGATGLAGQANAAKLESASSAATATPTTTGVVTTVADAIRALARGDDVCGSSVTVAARTRTPACTGGPTQSRAGATITFNNCQTAGGGLITGTVDISSSATASTAVCSSTTMITTTHTTTITNLTYVAPSGFKAVIPQQTDTGTNTYAFGTAPPTITLTTMGRLQTFGSDGVLLSDTNFNGTPTISFGGSSSGFTIDGTITTTDNRLNGARATYVSTGVTRVATCCRPVAGTVLVTTGDNDSDNIARTYTWGPTCGDLTLDGQILTSIPACI